VLGLSTASKTGVGKKRFGLRAGCRMHGPVDVYQVNEPVRSLLARKRLPFVRADQSTIEYEC
jgi:hypothetical protein